MFRHNLQMYFIQTAISALDLKEINMFYVFLNSVIVHMDINIS